MTFCNADDLFYNASDPVLQNRKQADLLCNEKNKHPDLCIACACERFASVHIYGNWNFRSLQFIALFCNDRVVTWNCNFNLSAVKEKGLCCYEAVYVALHLGEKI